LNKTVIFIAFVVLAALGIVAYVVLLALGVPDAGIAGFTALFLNVLGLVTVAAGTFYQLGKQGQKLETIERNTNGRLEAKDAQITELQSLLVQHGIDPAPTSR